MIKTLEQVRESIERVVNIINAISFKESILFKDFKLLQKVEKHLFNLSYSIITTNEGVLLL